MTFGKGAANFLVDSPAAVAQAVKTRLLLFAGEWFLDTSEGVPWYSRVLGAGTSRTRDRSIRARILGTRGVKEIVSYQSVVDPGARTMTVTARISTIYGVTDAVVVLGT
jgi:hypothetical protein